VRARARYSKIIRRYQIILHTAREIMFAYVVHVAVDINGGKGK
jgi:hypothetical protein